MAARGRGPPRLDLAGGSSVADPGLLGGAAVLPHENSSDLDRCVEERRWWVGLGAMGEARRASVKEDLNPS